MAKKNGSGVHPIWWILGGTVAVGAVVGIGSLLFVGYEADKMMSKPFPSTRPMAPPFGGASFGLPPQK